MTINSIVSSARVDVVALETHRRIEQFLFNEADLLDSWRFREWLTLLDKDISYWAPVRENRLHRERAKETHDIDGSAHLREDLALLNERVDRLYTHMAWAEEPPSRTRHLVTNVRVAPGAGPEEFEVESSFYLYRTRGERDIDHVVGKRYDLIRMADTPYGFTVVRRKIVFDMATLLVKNLSLFY